jgi:hypothetical protein
MSILKVCMNRYLDTVYNDLDCLSSSVEVTWYKNGKRIAGVTKTDQHRLRLSSSEFITFRSMFSLPWSEPKDDIFLLEIILPYLKFNGGSPAIPVLQDLGFIDEINHIALPSNWE